MEWADLPLTEEAFSEKLENGSLFGGSADRWRSAIAAAVKARVDKEHGIEVTP
jgi:hypothetical protein